MSGNHRSSFLSIGGCAGSFAASSDNRIVFNPGMPRQIERTLFSRRLYGGCTTSLLICHKDTMIVVDQGSGASANAEFILSKMNIEHRNRAKVYCLLTHGHGDHTLGLTGNTLFFNPGITLACCSPDLSAYRRKPEEFPDIPMMEKIIADCFHEVYFPVTLDMLPAKREHVVFMPGASFMLGDVTVHTIPLPHPGGCVGYSFDVPKVGRIVIATDFELGETPDPAISDFFDGAKFLYTEMQYGQDEYDGLIGIGSMKAARRGWGHSTPEMVFAVISKCKRKPRTIRIGHHDPRRDDNTLRTYYEHTVDVAARMRLRMPDFQFAHDGDIYYF